MKVKLIAYTPNAVEVCASAGRGCYSDKSSATIMGQEKWNAEKTLKNIIGYGHYSVLEHASFTFSIEGVSRALTHQLVRHRIASFSQQSQRYVNMKDCNFVTPKSINNNSDALKIYTDAVEQLEHAYDDLIKLGVNQEDARYILPNACETNITMTMNARELLHFFELRCCTRAQWEIRMLANEMLKQCKQVYPVIFEKAGATCERGYCNEGAKSCGKLASKVFK